MDLGSNAPTWHLVAPDREKKGGNHHIQLEEAADRLRLSNDTVHEQIRGITQELKASEMQMEQMLQQMASPEYSAMPPTIRDTNRQVLVKVVGDMEARDFKKAGLDLRNSQRS